MVNVVITQNLKRTSLSQTASPGLGIIKEKEQDNPSRALAVAYIVFAI
jgi:hypothetical protein